MSNTYLTMASFYAKIKYFSLDSTFNIDRMRPVKRTSLYNFTEINIYGLFYFLMTESR